MHTAGRGYHDNRLFPEPALTPEPIVPWMGGKRRLVPFILPLFPPHTCYVEAFAGGAALFFAKDQSHVEVLNDINGELVNLYRVVQHHLEEFVRQFKWALTSRQVWLWQQATPPETLTDIQRAARFYYLQRNAFGGKVSGQNFGTATTAPPRLNLLRIEEELSAAHIRFAGVYIEHLAWDACVARYDRPHTLAYLDPPYWETEGYGVDFGFEHYVRMAELARSIKGTMIISINDHPEIRRVFAGLPMQAIPITYTVGGGDASAERMELVIGNWRDGWPAPRPLSQQFDLVIPT